MGTANIAIPSTTGSLPAHVFANETLENSLFGITELTEQGCNVTFSPEGVTLSRDGDDFHYSPKSPSDMFWQLPLAPAINAPNSPSPIDHANSLVSLPSDRDFVAFMHASLGSPVISTLLRALRRQWLGTIPRLTAALVHKHRPNSIATALGHLDQTRQGLHSTATINSYTPPSKEPPLQDHPDTNSSDNPDAADFTPDEPYDASDTPLVFCKLMNVADFDSTGRFPVQSINKNEYMLVSYFKGSIHVEPMPSRHHTSYITAYQRTFDHWKQYGPLPGIVRLDNETSHQLEAFIEPVSTFQYFPPGNHRANRAERAIRTWKNHFLATIATASKNFPMRHWDKLIPIAELTLNCLLPWHPDPSISAHHGLTGTPFDFRAHPIGPAGTAIIIHDKPDDRQTWQMHGTPGFYLGPALKHYRVHRCLSSHTNAERNADTVAWFPDSLLPPPPLTEIEALHAAVLDLRTLLQRHLRQDENLSPLVLPPSLLNDLQDLAIMYNPTTTMSASEERVLRTTPTNLLVAQPSSLPTNVPSGPRVDIQGPNVMLPATLLRTKPLPPVAHHPYQTRSSTDLTRDTTATFAYQALLSNATTFSSEADHYSHDSLHDYITAWYLHLLPHSPNWVRAITHLAHANGASTTALNLNDDGSPLTYRTAKSGPNSARWQEAEDAEISRLLDTEVMFPRQPTDQPAERRSDTTYYNPQTKEKITDNEKVYRIRGTIGGDRINYTGVTKANTAAMPVVKMLLQSAVSEDADFMTIDIKDFYLNTLLPRSEWMRIPVRFLSTTVLDKYNLHRFVHKGSILFEVVRSLYGLPHAGKIAQDALIAHLANSGYQQTSTPCLFRHANNGVAFTLIVDDFGVKYIAKASCQHLLDCLQQKYKLTINWNADKYLGMTLRFDRKERLVALSIPGYIAKVLQRFNPQSHGANSPAIYTPPQLGAKVQTPYVDTSPLLSTQEVTAVQGICGALLYYCIAVDPTGYPAVTALACEQSRATVKTRAAADRVLAYFRKYPNNELVLKGCKMRLHQQADGSYLSRPGARSVAGGISYLSNDDPTEINGAIHVMSSVIPTVMSSIGETEYAACFLTGQHGAGFRNVLADLGYPQPPTYILTDNKCAEGIANNSIQPKRTKSLEMQYHWLRDRVARNQFIVEWRKGQHNLADFFTKALPVHVHQSFMPLLVHTPTASSIFTT